MQEALTATSTGAMQDAKYDAILAELQQLRGQVAAEHEPRPEPLGNTIAPPVVQPAPVATPPPLPTIAHVPLPSVVREKASASSTPLPPAVDAAWQGTGANRDIKQSPAAQHSEEDASELLDALDLLLHNSQARERTYAIDELGVSEKEGHAIYLQELLLARERWHSLEDHFTTAYADDPNRGGIRSTSCAGRVSPHETAAFSVLVVGSGSGYLSMKIAHTYPKSIVLSMERNETKMWYHRRNLEQTATLNDVVVASRIDGDAIATLSQSSAFFRFSVVTDFLPLLEELLPHELETPMGQLLQMAQTSFVIKPDPAADDRRHERFFDYWHSFDVFLRDSTRTTGMDGARITSVSADIKRVDIATLTAHPEGRPFKKCVKQRGSSCSEESSFSLRFQAPMLDTPITSFGLSGGVPLRCSGVPVDLLLQLEVYPETMSRLYAGLAFTAIPEVDGPVAPLPLAAVTELTHNGIGRISAFTADFFHYDSQQAPAQQDQRSFDWFDRPAPIAMPSNAPVAAPSRSRQAVAPSPIPVPSFRAQEAEEEFESISFLDDDYDDYGDGSELLLEAKSVVEWAEDDGPRYDDDDVAAARSTWAEFMYDDDDDVQGRGRDRDDDVIRYIQQYVANIDDDDEEEDLFNAFPYDPSTEAAGVGRKLLAITRDIPVTSTPLPLHRREIEEITVSPAHVDHLLERAVSQFEDQWSFLREEIGNIRNRRGSWLVSNSGVSLLAGKLAKKFPSATVVAVDPAAETADHQVDMAEMLRLFNLLVAQGDLADSHTVDALLTGPTIFRYHVLDLATLVRPTFAVSQQSICSRFGDLLSLAGTTFVVVPDDRVAAAAFSLLGRSQENNLPAIAEMCAARAGAQVQVRTIPAKDRSNGRLLRVDVLSLDRQLEISEDRPYRKHVALHYRALSGSATVTATSDGTETDCSAFSLEMVDVASLIALGLDREYKSALAVQYLQADLREDMNPAFLFWPALRKPLSYCNPETGERHVSHALRAEEAHYDEMGRVLVDEIRAREFSFLHLNSGKGELSKWIAWLRPESTVVSIETDVELFEAHHSEVEEELLHNNLVCNSQVDAELMALIGRSPEFFEYGMVSGVVTMARRSGFDFAKGVLSGAMRLSRSTFVELPTSTMLSLAHCSIFPEEMPGGRPVSFRKASHPLPLWANSSHRLLGELIDAEGLEEVAVTVLPYPDTEGREIVRLDVVDMMRQVRHHFLLPRHEFKETHSRTYMLHQHLAGFGPAVGPVKDDDPPQPPTDEVVMAQTYLVRDDGSAIVYDEFGITLVATLRLGVHAETKERLYHEFMKMGMREDMAPWNIQFKAGHLHYVDKDSGSFDFEAHMPYVYQVLLAMINWKSTVQSFDHCGQNTKLKYDVPIINFCVGAAEVPACDDLAHAVPCADGNCYSTFVGCLRALSALEEETQQELLTNAMVGARPPTSAFGNQGTGIWASTAAPTKARNTVITLH